jgi:hypothetical protein
MNQMEKRQARRLIRYAKEVEYELFQLISWLQEYSGENAEQFDWEMCQVHLHRVEQQLPMMFALVANTRRELGKDVM